MKKIYLILLCIFFIINYTFAGTKQIIISRGQGSYSDINTYFGSIMGMPDADVYPIIDNVESVFPTSGKIRNFYVEFTVQANDCPGPACLHANRVNTIYKNGIATNISCESGTINWFCTDTDTNNIAKGDRIAFGSYCKGGINSCAATEIMTSIEWEPDVDNETVFLGGYGHTARNQSLGYIPLHGKRDTNETAAPDVSAVIAGDFNITDLIVYRKVTPTTGYIDFNIQTETGTKGGCRLGASDQQCTIAFNPPIFLTDFNQLALKETSTASTNGNPLASVVLKALDNNNFIISTSTDTTLYQGETFSYYFYNSAGAGSIVDTNVYGEAKGRAEHRSTIYSTEFSIDQMNVSLDRSIWLLSDFNFIFYSDMTQTNVFCDINADIPAQCSTNADLEIDNNAAILEYDFHKNGGTVFPIIGTRETLLFKPTPTTDPCTGACTYSGGDFVIPCGCSCHISTAQDLDQNRLIISNSQGTGTTIISNLIVDINRIYVMNTCTLKGSQWLVVE